MPECDAPFGEVVRRHLQGDAVAREYADAVAAQLAGQVGQYGAFLIQLHTEQAAGKFFNYCACDFNAVFFAHSPPNYGDYSSTDMSGGTAKKSMNEAGSSV